MKVTRALYPTDFSEDSLQSIKDAIEYCIQNSKELVVLYTYRLINHQKDRLNKYSLKKDLDSKAIEVFKELEENYLKKQPINYRLLSEVGFVDDRIKRNIDKYDVDNILLCRSLYDTLESKIEVEEPNNKKLFEKPVTPVF